jgi:triosephosphate isomerase
MHKLIVANYKMNGNKEFFVSLQKEIKKSKDTEIILCPPFVYLSYLKNKSNISIGAQNVSCEVNGKRTGDISADMLKDVGVKYCIVGHSERNQPYNTDEIVARKVQNCVNNKIIPIICFGESDQSKFGDLEKIIKKKIKYVKECEVVFVYEPIWILGTGKIASSECINQVSNLIKIISQEFGLTSRFIYGGGVNLSNFKEFKGCEIDGFMIGKLCLDEKSFNEFLRGIENE